MKKKPFKLQGKKCKILSNFNEEKNSLIYIYINRHYMVERETETERDETKFLFL